MFVRTTPLGTRILVPNHGILRSSIIRGYVARLVTQMGIMEEPHHIISAIYPFGSISLESEVRFLVFGAKQGSILKVRTIWKSMWLHLLVSACLAD